jgi:hypothetical protein
MNEGGRITDAPLPRARAADRREHPGGGARGAHAGDLISNGDKNFLRSLYDKSVENNENFYNRYLEPLFYDALNTKSEKAGSFYRPYFDCQIPFLNGGLFEPFQNYNWSKEFLNIPNELFSSNSPQRSLGSGILDVFDSYNFTVYENDPYDKEVSIDPEMLGQIFEKLGAITSVSFDEWADAIETKNKTKEMEANKKLGVYYTPREIVHYMCNESIKNFLLSNLSEVDENSIERCIELATELSNNERESFEDLPNFKIEQNLHLYAASCRSFQVFLAAMYAVFLSKYFLYVQERSFCFIFQISIFQNK